MGPSQGAGAARQARRPVRLDSFARPPVDRSERRVGILQPVEDSAESVSPVRRGADEADIAKPRHVGLRRKTELLGVPRQLPPGPERRDEILLAPGQGVGRGLDGLEGAVRRAIRRRRRAGNYRGDGHYPGSGTGTPRPTGIHTIRRPAAGRRE